VAYLNVLSKHYITKTSDTRH